MESYKQLSQTTYLCNDHVVFCPKCRFRILHGKLGQRVRAWTIKISEGKGVETLEGHVSKNHVHPVLSIPPEHAISNVLGTIKGPRGHPAVQICAGSSKKVLGPQVLVSWVFREYHRRRRDNDTAIRSKARGQRAASSTNGL